MKRILVALSCLSLTLSPVSTTSCSFFSAPVVENNLSENPSYDGNVANSGIVGVVDGKGFEVTPHFRTRYNLMVVDYGDQVSEGIKQDDGLTKLDNGNWIIDKQHMVYFLDMNQFRKNGAKSKQ